MERKNLIIYWIATGLLSIMMIMSVGMYFFNHSEVSMEFTLLGYPTYLIYPLAIAKLLGLIAILSKLSCFLKRLAYAGFFYDFILAFFAHIYVGDNDFWGAIIALTLLVISYMYDKRLFDQKIGFS